MLIKFSRLLRKLFVLVLRQFVLSLQRMLNRWERKDPLPIGFSIEKSISGLPTIQDPDGARLVLSTEKRLGRYSRGIQKTLDSLRRSYGLSLTPLDSKSVFVDVGANIGEFGVMLEELGVRYVAFEPDPAAFQALSENVLSKWIYRQAVSDSVGTQKLYLATDDADTSLIPGGVELNSILAETITLDSICVESLRLTDIDVLKIEAEGAEPEVLRGATQTLKATKICVIDAGAERHGESTIPECFSIMQENGFALKDVLLPRGVMVFKRSNGVHRPQSTPIG